MRRSTDERIRDVIENALEITNDHKKMVLMTRNSPELITPEQHELAGDHLVDLTSLQYKLAGLLEEPDLKKDHYDLYLCINYDLALKVRDYEKKLLEYEDETDEELVEETAEQ